jgi:hypothetical protein
VLTGHDGDLYGSLGDGDRRGTQIVLRGYTAEHPIPRRAAPRYHRRSRPHRRLPARNVTSRPARPRSRPAAARTPSTAQTRSCNSSLTGTRPRSRARSTTHTYQCSATRAPSSSALLPMIALNTHTATPPHRACKSAPPAVSGRHHRCPRRLLSPGDPVSTATLPSSRTTASQRHANHTKQLTNIAGRQP